MIAVFKTLAERYSPKHVLWRFDPIILSSITPEDVLLERFHWLAKALHGYTERCIISFVDFYRKTTKRLNALAAHHHIHYITPSAEERRTLMGQLVRIAAQYQIQIRICCETELLGVPGVQQAHCVDAELLQELFPAKFQPLRKAPTRNGCGCYASRDIGAYDTCISGCEYCYATTNHQQALKNYQHHDPQFPILSGIG
jgi:hypothetical protein